MKLKLEMSMKILPTKKKCLTLVIIQLFSNYSTKSKYYDDSNKLFVCKMKDETGGCAIEGFIRLKPKMYSFLVDDNSDHKKVRGVNKNATISHNEYEEVLLNKKCLRHSMNRI